jgi:hypothetical protein
VCSKARLSIDSTLSEMILFSLSFEYVSKVVKTMYVNGQISCSVGVYRQRTEKDKTQRAGREKKPFNPPPHPPTPENSWS